MRRLQVLFVTFALACAALVHADETVVRIASYNIKFLDATTLGGQTGRRDRLQQVIAALDADVIGLQEIRNTAALRTILPASEWTLLIDEDSTDAQNVAIAVRRPLGLKGVSSATREVDADDEHFLFPNSSDDSLFPRRRDVIFAEIEIPGTTETVHVFVVHPKARVGGRDTTDPRREGAAAAVVRELEHRFHEQNVIVLGDYNDNPDDRSLNILETGDPDAHGGAEEEAGTFLVNVSEALVVQDHVSHGRTNGNVANGRIVTIDPGSRARNNDMRGTDENTGDILFDQILITPNLSDNYRADSARVFDDPIAVDGNNNTRASDHLPTFAEFAFGTDDGGPDPVIGLRIVRLLPDPSGADQGRETVTLRNGGGSAVNLNGWVLRDRGNNEFPLDGNTVPANSEFEIRMTTFVMPLNNSGDEVLLVNTSGMIVHSVTYEGVDVTPGNPITFP